MSVSGTFGIDIAFTDSTTVGGAQSLKTIAMREATEYTTGKVAIETATCGTAFQFFGYAGYRNAAGNTQSLTPRRLAFRASPAARIINDFGHVLTESEGNVCVDNWRDHVGIQTTAGTATYTLVIYGD